MTLFPLKGDEQDRESKTNIYCAYHNMKCRSFLTIQIQMPTNTKSGEASTGDFVWLVGCPPGRHPSNNCANIIVKPFFAKASLSDKCLHAPAPIRPAPTHPTTPHANAAGNSKFMHGLQFSSVIIFDQCHRIPTHSAFPITRRRQLLGDAMAIKGHKWPIGGPQAKMVLATQQG